MSKVEMRKQEEKWKAEADMRTLMEAEEIRRDAKRLTAARMCAKEKLIEMSAVVSAAGAAPDKS